MTYSTLSGTLLDDDFELTITDLCRACSTQSDWIVELVDEGVLDPIGTDQRHWRFSASSLRQAHTAVRLQRDLGVNLAGVALVLELMDEITALRSQFPQD